jgi:rabenosyn-5
VLGSGKNLSPAVSPQPPAHHRRNASFLSPSESSVSLSSQTSNSPASTAEPKEDITSKVLLGPSDNAAASASSRLVCPICNEEMVGHDACPI